MFTLSFSLSTIVQMAQSEILPPVVHDVLPALTDGGGASGETRPAQLPVKRGRGRPPKTRMVLRARLVRLERRGKRRIRRKPVVRAVVRRVRCARKL